MNFNQVPHGKPQAEPQEKKVNYTPSALQRVKTRIKDDFKDEPEKTSFGKVVKDNLNSLKRSLHNIKSPQWIDMALFAGFVAVVYNYSSSISETVDTYVPTEEKMAEMFQEMQRQMEAEQAAMAAQAQGRMM